MIFFRGNMEQRGPADDSLAASAMTAITRLHPESGSKLSLAKIRHGLRTPINHIIGYAEILQEEAADKLPVGFVSDLEKIRSGGNMLLARLTCFSAETEAPPFQISMQSATNSARP
jgi:adenylate cyclase